MSWKICGSWQLCFNICVVIVTLYIFFLLLFEHQYSRNIRPVRTTPVKGKERMVYDYYDLLHAMTLDHDYEYFIRDPFDDPKPRDNFTSVPWLDVFSRDKSLCRSSSRHDPKIVNSRNGTKSCYRTVKFVGMCGKFATALCKFPFVVKCPKCKIVVDHVALPHMIADADLVVFTHIGRYMSLALWEDLLRYKHSKQRWVFSTIESAIYVRGLLTPWKLRKSIYDYTETFLSSLDITTPYGFYRPFQIGKPRRSWNDSSHLEGKANLVAWTASHCETLQWDRSRFAEDLGKVLPKLDTYGKCGKKTICKDIWNPNCSRQFDDLMATYKFVLSLENSCCSEYITEKFWKTLEQGIVPVVVGPSVEDLNNLAPPESFIHADQFTSMKQLAKYLLYLDKNDKAYNEYFAWKRKGEVHQDTTPEHYKRIVSDEMICKLVGLWEREMDDIKNGVNVTRRPFDVFSSEWQGTCVTCGRHDWLKEYEYPPEHRRKSKSLWA